MTYILYAGTNQTVENARTGASPHRLSNMILSLKKRSFLVVYELALR